MSTKIEKSIQLLLAEYNTTSELPSHPLYNQTIYSGMRGDLFHFISSDGCEWDCNRNEIDFLVLTSGVPIEQFDILHDDIIAS